MNPNVICSDVRLSDLDWVQPVNNWKAPPRVDHGPQLAELLNKTGTRVILDVAGVVHCSPIDVPNATFTLEGSAGGCSGNVIGCTVLGKFDPAQTHVLSIGGGTQSVTGPTLRNLFVRSHVADGNLVKETGGDAIRILSGQSIEVDNVQIVGFDRCISVDVVSRLTGLTLRRLRLKPIGVGITVDSPIENLSNSSCAAIVIEQLNQGGGTIALHVRRPVAKCISVLGGICEAQTLASLVFDGGRAKVDGIYLENAPVLGKRPPAFAVRNGAKVAVYNSNHCGAFVDVWSEATFDVDAITLETLRDSRSGQVLPIKASELPLGLPAVWTPPVPPAAAAA